MAVVFVDCLYCLITVVTSVVMSDVFGIHTALLLWVFAVFYRVCFVILFGDFPYNVGLLTFFLNKFFNSSAGCI